MAKLTYVLRQGKSKSSTIQLFFNYGSEKRLRYSTGLKILDSKNWDTQKMRIRNVSSEIHKNTVNNRLTEIQFFLEKFHTSCLANGKSIDNEILKDSLDIFLNKVKPSNIGESIKLELLPFYDWYISHYLKNPMVSTGKPMGKGTAKTYRNSYNILQKFSDTVYKLNYSKINIDFYDNFLKFMHEQNYSLNYIGTSLKNLKTIMNASLEKGFHNNLEFRKRYFKKPFEEVYNIYLNNLELQKICELDLSDFISKKVKNNNFVITSQKIQNARDLFLISANTGLRVSDFNNLTSENIITEKGLSYISIITKKNSKQLTIPINATVKGILEKRGGNPPLKMPEQHINYCLKEIGELAEINDLIEKKITKGGVSDIKSHKKFELITNHTGRRSFCTNAYKSGIPTIDIMAISGHSTEKVFYNYIKVDDLERAEKIGKHDFFK